MEILKDEMHRIFNDYMKRHEKTRTTEVLVDIFLTQAQSMMSTLVCLKLDEKMANFVIDQAVEYMKKSYSDYLKEDLNVNRK